MGIGPGLLGVNALELLWRVAVIPVTLGEVVAGSNQPPLTPSALIHEELLAKLLLMCHIRSCSASVCGGNKGSTVSGSRLQGGTFLLDRRELTPERRRAEYQRPTAATREADV